MNYPYFMLLLIFFKISTEEPVVEIKASENHNAQAPKKVTLLLGVIGDEQKELDFFLKKLTQNISYSGQLDLIQKKFLAPKTKEEVTDLFKAGYPLVLFLQFFAKENMLEWRLYDSIEAEMVKGKKYSRTGLLQPRWAHGISADIWPELCQEPGIFLTKIAYVKQLHTPRKYRSQICIADFDGSNEKIIVDMPTVYVHLSFHPDIKNPRLLASEFTPSGIRLLMIDFKGNKKIIFGKDRSIVGTSLSADAEKVVYTESGDIWLYNHSLDGKQKKHIRMIQNEQKCSSASLCPDESILYCSDCKIYRYDPKIKKNSCLIDNGLAPAYDSVGQKIVFSRRIKGVMQLMLFDEITLKIEQLTYDSGNKSDSCFSPCGNYVLYCYEKNNKKNIANFCLATKRQQIVTSGKYSFSYPAWSRSYKDLEG